MLSKFLLIMGGRLFRFAGLGVLSLGSIHALDISVYSEGVHDRFLGFPNNPSHNTSFIFHDYNLTGVGWLDSDVRRQFTMISPIHFVGANHFKPNLNVSQTVSFLGDGVISRIIGSQLAITTDAGGDSDLLLGKISSPLESIDGISFHPYYNTSGSTSGESLIVLGSDGQATSGPRGGTATVSGETNIQLTTGNLTRSLRWVYFDGAGGDNSCFLEAGDSGSPTFIDQNGVAAVVGINSATGSTFGGGVTNFGTLIPYYADKLNASMALDGYHLTKAIPGSTTLELTRTAPTEVIRAGHNFTISFNLTSLENLGDVTDNETADNVKFMNSFSTNAVIADASGAGWFDESDNFTTKARRAFINNNDSASYTITLNIPTSGTTVQNVTYYADQFSAVTESFDIEVVESFISWGSGLTDISSKGDDDDDGINNLLEYAFGGDPSLPARNLPNSKISILPTYTGDTLTYLRRMDRDVRGLTYTVMTSTTLDGNWVEASSYITEETSMMINSGLEAITVNINSAESERYFKVNVTLDEL